MKTLPGLGLFLALLTGLLTALLTAPTAQAQPTEGEVRKIDKPKARVTLRHAEIKSLDMPPMTMVFRVRDTQLLDTLTLGDKVRFEVEKLNAELTVTQLVKTP